MALAAVVLVVLAGCGGSASSAKARTRTITLEQAVPNLTNIDTNVNGSLGDQLVFEAPVTRNGKPFGAVYGELTNAATAPQARDTTAEERLSLVVFDLPGGQISVFGGSYYLPGQRELEPKRDVARAIIGGTGKYLGADGEVVTTRLPDGTYTHVIRLVG